MDFQQMLLWALIFGEDDEKTIRVKFANHVGNPEKMWLPGDEYFFIQNSPLPKNVLEDFGLTVFDTNIGTFAWGRKYSYYHTFVKMSGKAGYTIVAEPLEKKIPYVAVRR